MTRILAALAAITIPASASATTWVSVADCGDVGQVRFYSYDASSVRTVGNARSVKIRGDYSQHSNSRAREARMLWSFDCQARTFKEASRKEIGAGGKVVENFRTSTPSMPIIPDSVADKVFAVVCA